MKQKLHDVTICAIDCINPNLAIDAILKSSLECEFKESIIFTDTPQDRGALKTIQIDKIFNKDGYSKFLIKELHKHLQTSHVLIVQWDGYVIDGSQWDSSFLDYDYIGAKWNWHKDGMNIGNGGFSLRSKKLLDVMAESSFHFIPNMNEDEQICRVYRNKLESQYSIKFPSEQLADKFAYERSLPNQPTFGFHGLFNLWRYLSDDEMVNAVKAFHPNTYHSIEYFELVLQYFSMRKFSAMKYLYVHIKEHCSDTEIKEKLNLLVKDANFVNWFTTTY